MLAESPRPPVSVGVVGICGAPDIDRCLRALHRQEDAPSLEVVVAYDPLLEGVEDLAPAYPNVRFVANYGQRSPLELASRAVRETQGELVLLTEDHCVPAPDWVAQLTRALRQSPAAAGGVVEVDDGASPVDWALYFVDFFRYAPPVGAGRASSLTVCNVAYRRADLERLRVDWKTFFHETIVNEDLQRTLGPLHLEPSARVTMHRHVRLRDALLERYSFGRLFGCTRLQLSPTRLRVAYRLLAPALPALLMGRMVQKAQQDEILRAQFRKAAGPIFLMVLAWSAGEWVGYLTGERPRRLTVAPEIESGV